MKSQPSILFDLRKEFKFDALEKIIYTGALNLLLSNLESKIFQAKQKNPHIDTTEQDKMTDILRQHLRWIEGLYEITGKFMSEFKSQEEHIQDLHSINEILYAKVEFLESELNKIKAQNNF